MFVPSIGADNIYDIGNIIMILLFLAALFYNHKVDVFAVNMLQYTLVVGVLVIVKLLWLNLTKGRE